MKATLLLKHREVISEHSFVERVAWLLERGLEGSAHTYKYRLAYVVDGVCVVRYDNEAGKGDHRHIGGAQLPYAFTGAEQLLADFWQDVSNWSAK